MSTDSRPTTSATNPDTLAEFPAQADTPDIAALHRESTRWSVFASAGLRGRLMTSRVLTRLGFGDGSFLMPLSVLIGVVTAAAAVAFHELINGCRDLLYHAALVNLLYGKGVLLLILLPALGGLAVGAFSTFVMRSREGHGVVDVMEMVSRGGGWVRPLTAVEKILTAAFTIGSGGSAGAEGPIVQIGAAISSMFGRFFHVARPFMPVLIGCGTAAGISAIFNSPIGGVLFTLEVILLDFSVRTFTPVVVASVVANVTTGGIFSWVEPNAAHRAIFDMAGSVSTAMEYSTWGSVPGFLVLGVACGLIGVSLTRLMYSSEELFRRLPLPRWLRPGIGGALLGLLGVAYVVVFGWLVMGRPKPIDFTHYPMPAFFGDGYGVIRQLLDSGYYAQHSLSYLLALLATLCVLKIVGTCLTLSSGGSGGIIAPSLFLGAVTGAIVAILLRSVGLVAPAQVSFFALIGMGAVLAAVVHAPLAAILILFDVSRQSNVILPAMLATTIATGTARLLFRDSIYTLTLRRRGVRVGNASDLSLLRRLTIEQVGLEPVNAIRLHAPFDMLLQTIGQGDMEDVLVVDANGGYVGMVVAADIRTALVQRDAMPLLLVDDLLRPEIPAVKTSDDLVTALETFSRFEVSRLPVSLANNPSRVIGLISRASLMRRYHRALTEG